MDSYSSLLAASFVAAAIALSCAWLRLRVVASVAALVALAFVAAAVATHWRLGHGGPGTTTVGEFVRLHPAVIVSLSAGVMTAPVLWWRGPRR